MKKLLPIMFLIVAVMISGCVGQTSTTGDVTQSSNVTADLPSDDTQSEKIIGKEVSKTFVLTGVNFKFFMDEAENPELRVKEGDTVRVEFTSTDGFHDWVVDEFNAVTEKVKTGNSTFVEFVADKKGTFEYYCSVGSHRINGMKGNLIVE